MKTRFFLSVALYGTLYACLSGSFSVLADQPLWLLLWIPLFFLCQGLPGLLWLNTRSLRLRGCWHGTVLLGSFLLSVVLSVGHHTWLAFQLLPDRWTELLWSLLLSVGAHTVLFWNGILWLYFTSVQLGIKRRVVGILCGMIPVVNLVALGFILATTFREVATETAREALNNARKNQKVCQTRYPILMIHGVFFRDSHYLNYWGRIPGELEKNGATVYYGNHASAASVADAAQELAQRIRQVLGETGAEKVNIIAHSKGGLDCRAALADPEVAAMVASLTTVNTPHRGCLFADYLLTKIPEAAAQKVARAYNAALNRLGEPNADFLAAVRDLTESACYARNKNLPPPEGVYCQSVGSRIKGATGGKFPLNFSYHIVKYFDGANDGLVSDTAFSWGEKTVLLEPSGRRGISHGDMIDLNRENIPGFDVREFYVNLVADLKARGL